MTDILVPIALFVTLFGFLSFGGYLKYRRDMAMIEKGLDPRGSYSEASRGVKGGEPRAYVGPSRMERALTLSGIGLALTIGLSFTGLGPQLLGGLIPLFIGLSRLLAILLEQEQAKDKSAAPGGRKIEESTK